MLTTPMVVKLVHENLDAYKELASKAIVVICPPATALRELQKIANHSNIRLGAQTCGAATAGAYTGDISPADLFACGASYCIIGHSERRSLYHESNDRIATKSALLAALHISPIICIGESSTEREAGKTMAILEEQLLPILNALHGIADLPTLLIAYEPIWAIGSGLTPDQGQLCSIFSALKEFMSQKAPDIAYKFLYGGSVSTKTISTLSQIKPLDGFLIGGASLDFQEFKKIVDYFHCPASN